MAKSVWNMLRRNREGLVVGTAATLVVLAILAYAREGLVKRFAGPTVSLVSMTGQEPISPVESRLCNVPRDPEFYRDKWRQIANDFYALHPVELPQPVAKVVTASLSDQSDDVINATSQVSTAGHTVPTPAIKPTIASTIIARQQRISRLRPPAFFASIAAGLLAGILYSKLWPTKCSDQNHGLKCSDPLRTDSLRGDSLRIELPNHWVRIRPTSFQRLRPIVLAASYMGGILAAWSIV